MIDNRDNYPWSRPLIDKTDKYQLVILYDLIRIMINFYSECKNLYPQNFKNKFDHDTNSYLLFDRPISDFTFESLEQFKQFQSYQRGGINVNRLQIKIRPLENGTLEVRYEYSITEEFKNQRNLMIAELDVRDIPESIRKPFLNSKTLIHKVVVYTLNPEDLARGSFARKEYLIDRLEEGNSVVSAETLAQMDFPADFKSCELKDLRLDILRSLTDDLNSEDAEVIDFFKNQHIRKDFLSFVIKILSNKLLDGSLTQKNLIEISPDLKTIGNVNLPMTKYTGKVVTFDQSTGSLKISKFSISEPIVSDEIYNSDVSYDGSLFDNIRQNLINYRDNILSSKQTLNERIKELIDIMLNADNDIFFRAEVSTITIQNILANQQDVNIDFTFGERDFADNGQIVLNQENCNSSDVSDELMRFMLGLLYS